MRSDIFIAKNYRSSRTEYPLSPFQEARLKIEKSHVISSVCDLGSGSGPSMEVILKTFPSIQSAHLVDRDPKMIDEAKFVLAPYGNTPLSFAFQVGEADNPETFSHFKEESIDLITIGSALHWMDRAQVAQISKRLLRSDGFLFAFEYQFPKALGHFELNHWIKSEFNKNWKAPLQKPRGKFEDFFQPFLGDFKKIPLPKFKWIEALNQEQFLNQLFSQSRYLQFEKNLPPDEVALYREEISKKIEPFFSDSTLEFDFYFSSALLQKTNSSGSFEKTQISLG